jgi:hypothetical protein
LQKGVIDMPSKTKAGSRNRMLLAVSLVVVVVLVSSLFVYKFFAVDDSSVRVKNATELRDAINKVEVDVHVNIALTKDIFLGPALIIPSGADVTLKSDHSNDFFRLVGLNGINAITVEDDARLTLAGIIVTHETDSTGNGIVVKIGGVLIMVDGEISGNTANPESGGGGGVRNGGLFEISGGVVSGNTAFMGGGVENGGTFKRLVE